MSDPAIRVALEAAQREASSFYSLPETAAIVAAFLRAFDAGDRISPHLIAAAVEAEADRVETPRVG